MAHPEAQRDWRQEELSSLRAQLNEQALELDQTRGELLKALERATSAEMRLQDSRRDTARLDFAEIWRREFGDLEDLARCNSDSTVREAIDAEMAADYPWAPK